jgi:hypothetical protein
MTNLKSFKEKLSQFTTPFFEATPACLLVMVQGNILMATITHIQNAIETGLITGAGVFILSMLEHRWFRNKYVVAGITGGMCSIADFISHSHHFGWISKEAIITGAFTALISLALNFIGKKLFLHGRSKLIKRQVKD